MTRLTSCWLVLVLGLWVAGPAAAQVSDGEWRQIQANFDAAMKTDTVADKEQAVLALGRADRVEAVDLLFKVVDWKDPRTNNLLAEREKIQKQIDQIYAAAQNQGGQISQGEYDRYQNLLKEIAGVNEKLATGNTMFNAAVDALTAMRSEPPIERMISKGLTHSSWRVRAAVAQAFGEINNDAAAAKLIEMVGSDKDPKVATTAMDSLAKLRRSDAVDAIVRQLDSENWQVRIAAADSLAKIGDARAVEPLVERMQKEDGRMLEDFDAALKKLTGHTCHGNAGAWKSWFAANKDKIEEIVAAREETAEEGAEEGKTVTFYGIRTRSKRIIFIIDFSGSMTEPAQYIPQSAGTGGGAGPAGALPASPTRFDVARWELKNAVSGLDEKAKFNIIYFNDRVELLKPNGMLEASRSVKDQTYKWLDGLKAEGQTNVYDALARAFDLAGQGAVDANYKVGVDTIFFLTDGVPTTGTITDPMKILDDVAQRNMTRRIKIHVIGVGANQAQGAAGQPQNVDVAFLQKLAEDNWGEFVAR
ncbi:MAG: HEAT repeat domain-containing protein [Planctomycetes bacterium]|nr:HEAT repeat domain-containing protein [Planctomycetota bacterium]